MLVAGGASQVVPGIRLYKPQEKAGFRKSSTYEQCRHTISDVWTDKCFHKSGHGHSGACTHTQTHPEAHIQVQLGYS